MSRTNDSLSFTPVHSASNRDRSMHAYDIHAVLEHVSGHVYNALNDSYNNQTPTSSHTTCIFSLEPLRSPFTQESVQRFLEQFVEYTELEWVCLLPVMHYLGEYKRAITTFCIQDSNWQLMFLTAGLLASKMWEDIPIENSMIVRFITHTFYSSNTCFEAKYVLLKQVNRCEQAFAKSIDYQFGMSCTLYNELWDSVFADISDEMPDDTDASDTLMHDTCSPVSVSTKIHHSPIATASIRKTNILQQLIAASVYKWIGH